MLISAGLGVGAPKGGSDRQPRQGRRREAAGALVWRPAPDAAQALHDAPDIAPGIRLYTIGANVPDGLDRAWPTLFWIENGNMPNGSHDKFRGVYQSGEQSGEWNRIEFVSRDIRPHGFPGEAFPLAGPGHAGLKEVNSPATLSPLPEALGGVENTGDSTQED